MFNFIIKRRGPVVNILKRHVVKRQINNGNTSSSRSYPRRDEVVKNVEKQFRPKHCTITDLYYRRYSSLPEPIEATKPRKIFMSHEDTFAHSILESKEIYSTNIAKKMPVFCDEITKNDIDNYVNKSWKSLPIPEIIEAFKKISYYALKNEESILDEKYEKFIQYLVTNLKQLTDAEICDILLSITLWPVTYTRHDRTFKSLWLALDRECVRRAPQWTVDELLLISDHWYRVRLYKYSEFASYVIRKLGSKPSRMTPANLVQFMFYVNSSRKHPKDMYNLEYRMESCVDVLDLNELAILAMGFFKTQTPIRNSNLLTEIIRRVIKDVDSVHEISLAAFLKIIRYSSTMKNESGMLWELVLSTVPQIPRLSLQALMHILTMTVKIRIFHPELLTSIAERFNHEIKDARLKDMERLVLALTSFNFTPDIQPNILETIVQEISTEDRRPDLERYSKSLANLLQYLSVANIYPKDLIAFTLDPVNLKRVYGYTPFDLNHAILIIDLNVDVEVPGYTGPRLNNRSRSIVAKGYLNTLPEPNGRDLTARHKFLIEVMDTCKEIFGSTEMMHLDWVLPQYKEVDIIICLDKNNSPLPVKQILSEMPFGDIKRPGISLEGAQWLAIVIGAQNCYVRDTMQLLGKDLVKIRQLEKIGYKPIVIPWYEWYASVKDQKKYLKQMLFK